MCRRFSQFFSKEAREAFERNFGVLPPEPPYSRPTFNIPPGVDIHTVLRDSESNNQVREMFWGLIPSFAKEFKQHPKHRLDLTRVEVFYDEKDNFRKDLLKSSRCIIPINCYLSGKPGENKSCRISLNLLTRLSYTWVGFMTSGAGLTVWSFIAARLLL